MKSIILDMDPGIDDAAAIAVAVNNPDLDVKLITTVAGNVSVDKTTNNTLKLLEFFGKDIPVAAGAKAPLKKQFEDASYIHGASGMPGYDFPPVTTKPIEQDAVEAIHTVLQAADEAVTLIATGSYTNIAQFIQKYPEDFAKIEQLIMMGGTVSAGNTSSVSEFNVFTDPDAAKIVFESSLPKVMIGLDVTLKALITPATLDTIAKMGRSGAMLKAIIGEYSDQAAGGKPMHDVNTILYALNPAAIKTEAGNIDVVVDGPAIGATVWDFQNRWHDENTSNVAIGLDIDAEFFNKWFIEQVGNMPV
ncbi:possible pyrimidine nucleoside phosphorylase [Weissella oryzae SG25]|uniref:Possible pyrimidine nucleoside phosphorylase n=1 Tax=Weissella oryzae (strain DSM 25784 / JCM 18191 / LMG 30913 / SG25) TaxID=1329250 RepID=A0A069D0T6_WEIOS|nr:ribonucleoside hydrolase RihC [Weissella oryzae]GAK30946.1 possible pyrimidine nucleoside phosphorylase [Weissella oryzae SG25]